MPLIQPHARTVALIRRLHQLGTPGRRGRIPRQQQPDAIRLEYFKAIRPVCEIARRAFDLEQPIILCLLAAELVTMGRADADRMDKRRSAREAVDRAAKAVAANMRPHELHAVARKFGERTSEHQRQQLDRQVRAAVGVPYSAVEAPVRARLEEYAAPNVALIKTVPERYFDRIRIDVEEAFKAGTRPDELAKTLSGRYDMSENDAQRIARDQIGKLNGQVNQARQESLGLTGYTWRTMNDQRVREDHIEREGQHFEWDDPPEDGHPGEAIQCRCYSEPDFSPLLAD